VAEWQRRDSRPQPIWLPLPPDTEKDPADSLDWHEGAERREGGRSFCYTPGAARLLMFRDAGVAEWQTRDSRPQPSGSPSRPNASDWVSLRGPTPVR